MVNCIDRERRRPMEETTPAEDIKKLMEDNNRLHLRLERLEQDHAAWALKQEERDLEEITTSLKQMEIDVGVMLSTCFSLVRDHNGNGIGQNLRHAYVCLDALFQDVKKARSDLQLTYMQSYDLTQMQIDWARLKKTVGEILHYLKDETRR
jgi:hypothetical protein